MRDISKMDYFQNLMSVLVDNTRRLFRLHGKEYELMPEAYEINAAMTAAGTYTNKIPLGVIVHTVPQAWIRKLEQDCMPEYRRLACELVQHFRDTSKEQGLDEKLVDQHFEKEYIWN